MIDLERDQQGRVQISSMLVLGESFMGFLGAVETGIFPGARSWIDYLERNWDDTAVSTVVSKVRVSPGKKRSPFE